MLQLVTSGLKRLWRSRAILCALLLSGLALAKPVVRHAPAAAHAVPAIATDQLFDAQTALMAKMLAVLPARVAGRPNIYALAVAASGRQQLFSREAHLALQVAAARFGGDYRGGVLLSNGAPDLFAAPLATRGNVILAVDGLAHHADPAEDIAFVYLASHGSPDASLETDLPDLQGFTELSAQSLADALKVARFRRRIIVISACFSASWIPALANDDTIVITAAQSDRTSFGCDDTRRLTYFGEAFLEGPLAKGASLQEAFDAARRTVSGWEKAQRFLPSEPQAFVGRNMQALWSARGVVGR